MGTTSSTCPSEKCTRMTDNTVVPLLFPNNRHANLSTFLVISEQLLKIIFAEVSIPLIIHFTLALSVLSTLSEFSCVVENKKGEKCVSKNSTSDY